MEAFREFISGIQDPEQRARTEEVLRWVAATFPDLKARIAWNQPVFTDHGTYIVGFSLAKGHLAVGQEAAAIRHFAAELAVGGHSFSRMLIRFPWGKPVDYKLLEKVIRYNIEDKKDCPTFCRGREAAEPAAQPEVAQDEKTAIHGR